MSDLSESTIRSAAASTVIARRMSAGVETLADVAETIHTRLLALQAVLEAKGVVVDEEVKAKMQALRDASTLELEYGSDPLYEQFRQLRRLVEGSGDQPAGA